jgi:murein DD-endopeptidase MepM/ murein hydrolase activator NlpD
VNSIVGASIAPGGLAHLRSARVRLSFAIGAGALATLAVTGATALPSRGQADGASTIASPLAEPIRYLGAAADPASPVPQHDAADESAMRFSGRIGEDLTRSLTAAGVPERQGREYVALLGRAIELANGLSVEDRFDLVVERGEDGGLGRLIYAGLDRVGRADVALLKWTDGKSTIWVNAEGIGGESSAAMRLPVPGQITSRFGNRFHPILGSARFHKGVDLRAPMGAPIVAAADGRVVTAGWHGGYGRQVAIAHRCGVQTTYAHMSRIAAAPGQMVRQGQVIGYVGSSGLSTGPHLHYEVHKDGRPVNPMSVKLGAAPAQLQGEKLHEFRDALRQVLLLPARRG